MLDKSKNVVFDDKDGVPTMRDTTPEEHQRIQEQLQSDYKTYCNNCNDNPLSYENWLHCEINQVSKGNDDDLPF